MTDSREIAEYGGGGAVSNMREGGIPVQQRMAMLREALTNPDVDPAKALVMAELMFKMEDRDRQSEFNRDKIAAKAAMPAIFKRGFDNHKKTSYVLFEDMQRAIDPVLERFNLMLDFEVGNVGNDIAVTPILRHQNGWVERGGTLKGPSDTGPGRSAIQSVGSSVSYLKRYSTEAILNLIRDGEDNDGALSRENYRLNDRQEGIITEAQAAADAGTYAEWYGRLSVKDRAMMISTGYHARLGGALTLPGAKVEEPRQELRDPPAEQKRADPPANQERKVHRESTHDLSTPEGWTAQYEEDCRNALDLPALELIKRKGASAVKKLVDEHPKLFDRTDAAEMDARERFEQGDQGKLV